MPNPSSRYPFYFDNFITFFSPKKEEDGTYTIAFAAQKPIDGISVADGGPAVASVFDNPDEYIGKKVEFSGEKLSGAEYAAILSKVTGKMIKFSYVPPDVYANFPFPGAKDIVSFLITALALIEVLS